MFSKNAERMNNMHSVMKMFHKTEWYQTNQRFLSEISVCRLVCVAGVVCVGGVVCVAGVAGVGVVAGVADSIYINSTVLFNVRLQSNHLPESPFYAFL
jgi:preprotein translocase subunit SecF